MFVQRACALCKPELPQKLSIVGQDIAVLPRCIPRARDLSLARDQFFSNFRWKMGGKWHVVVPPKEQEFGAGSGGAVANKQEAQEVVAVVPQRAPQAAQPGAANANPTAPLPSDAELAQSTAQQPLATNRDNGQRAPSSFLQEAASAATATNEHLTAPLKGQPQTVEAKVTSAAAVTTPATDPTLVPPPQQPPLQQPAPQPSPQSPQPALRVVSWSNPLPQLDDKEKVAGGPAQPPQRLAAPNSRGVAPPPAPAGNSNRGAAGLSGGGAGEEQLVPVGDALEKWLFRLNHQVERVIDLLSCEGILLVVRYKNHSHGA